jgi:hypothetical protein
MAELQQAKSKQTGALSSSKDDQQLTRVRARPQTVQRHLHFPAFIFD